MGDAVTEHYFKTADNRAARVRIELDEDGSHCNPRETDLNGSVMLTFERAYISPDRISDLPNELYDAVQEYCSSHMDGRDVQMIQRFSRIFLPEVLFIGAITRNGYDGRLSINPTPQPGDGAVGVVVVTRDSIAGIDPDADTSDAQVLAEVEMGRYSDWATGEIYGYVAEIAVEPGADPGNDPEVVDQCWGYIGSDEHGHMMQQAIESLGDDVTEISQDEYESLIF